MGKEGHSGEFGGFQKYFPQSLSQAGPQSPSAFLKKLVNEEWKNNTFVDCHRISQPPQLKSTHSQPLEHLSVFCIAAGSFCFHGNYWFTMTHKELLWTNTWRKSNAGLWVPCTQGSQIFLFIEGYQHTLWPSSYIQHSYRNWRIYHIEYSVFQFLQFSSANICLGATIVPGMNRGSRNTEITSVISVVINLRGRANEARFVCNEIPAVHWGSSTPPWVIDCPAYPLLKQLKGLCW